MDNAYIDMLTLGYFGRGCSKMEKMMIGHGMILEKDNASQRGNAT